MADEIRVNRPAPVVAPQEPETKSSSKMPWLILGVVVLIIVVLGIVFRGKLFGGVASQKDTAATVASSKPSGYQAVFLTNGQVYFGKIQSTTDDTITMKDIFYLQVIQPQPLQGTPQEQQQQQQQQISLVKLGNELHGPVDEMHINRAQVLFYEDLKEDGRVVQAIKEYKANPQGTAPAAQQQAPSAQQQAPAPTK